MKRLLVGATLSQTGMYALQGQQALEGLRLWLDDTNARGGLFIPELRRPVPVQLVVYDDCSRRSAAEYWTERLISSDHVDFLIGPYSSGLVHAAAAIAEAHQKVLWNHGGSSDAIIRQGFRWSVHLPTPASGYLTGLFPCMLHHGVQAGRVAVIQRRRGSFSVAVADGVRAEARRSGFSILPTFFYPDDPHQNSTLAAALAAANPAVLIAVGRYEDDVALLGALAEAAVRATVVAAVAAPMQQFRRDLQDLAEGCVGPSQWESGAAMPVDSGPSPEAFVGRFRQRFRRLPDYPAAQAYAAGLILQRCVELAATCSDGALRAAADRLQCRTFYGDFRLDPETGQQVGHQTVLVQW